MLDFTPSEKRVVVILSAVLIIAGVFQLFRPYTEKEQLFDYFESDSIFSRLSHQPAKRTRIIDFSNEQEKTISSTARKAKQTLKPGTIDINTANEEDLKKLPRIGPAMAKRIVEYRDTHGPFRKVNDLTKVKGIGNKTLEKLKIYLKPVN